MQPWVEQLGAAVDCSEAIGKFVDGASDHLEIVWACEVARERGLRGQVLQGVLPAGSCPGRGGSRCGIPFNSRHRLVELAEVEGIAPALSHEADDRVVGRP